jgi:molybdate transport system substrate-binding protein
MIKPMSVIADVLEKREAIKISIIKGGSGNLLRSIKFNRQGDLYLPGSEAYIKQAMAEGLISESVHVGYNKAAMMVREGNPKGIQQDLDVLKSPNHYVVIGNPDSGSIGKETKKILTSAGIFEDVMQNVKELTTDSKRLIEVLKDGEADLVINWHATATWPENSALIDALPIDEQYANKKRLVLGLLNTAKHPEIARKFMDYATSDEGQRIFDSYGLYQVD